MLFLMDWMEGTFKFWEASTYMKLTSVYIKNETYQKNSIGQVASANVAKVLHGKAREVQLQQSNYTEKISGRWKNNLWHNTKTESEDI